MSHEKSRTVQRGRDWVNISGRDGRVLKAVFGFEKPSYRTLPEAESAARRRSEAWGQMPAVTALVEGAEHDEREIHDPPVVRVAQRLASRNRPARELAAPDLRKIVGGFVPDLSADKVEATSRALAQLRRVRLQEDVSREAAQRAHLAQVATNYKPLEPTIRAMGILPVDPQADLIGALAKVPGQFAEMAVNAPAGLAMLGGAGVHDALKLSPVDDLFGLTELDNKAAGLVGDVVGSDAFKYTPPGLLAGAAAKGWELAPDAVTDPLGGAASGLGAAAATPWRNPEGGFMLDDIGKASLEGIKETYAHPEDNAGYLLLDLLALFSAGAGAVGRVSAASRAARAAGEAGKSSTRAGLNRLVLGPPPETAQLRLRGQEFRDVDPFTDEEFSYTTPDLTVEKLISRNQLVAPIQRARVERLQRGLDRGAYEAPRDTRLQRLTAPVKDKAAEKFGAEAVFGRELKANRRVNEEADTALLGDLRHEIGSTAADEIPKLDELPASVRRGLSRGQNKLLQLVSWHGSRALEDPLTVIKEEMDAHARHLQSAGAEREPHLRHMADLIQAREAAAGAKDDPRFMRVLRLQQEASSRREAELVRRGLMTEQGVKWRTAAPAAVQRGEPLTEKVPTGEVEVVPGKSYPRSRGSRQRAYANLAAIGEVEGQVKKLSEAFEASRQRTRPRTPEEAISRRDELAAMKEKAVEQLRKEYGHPEIQDRKQLQAAMLKANQQASLVGHFTRLRALREKGLSMRAAKIEIGKSIDPSKLRGSRRKGYDELVRRHASDEDLHFYLGNRSMRGVSAALRARIPNLMKEMRDHAEERLYDLAEREPSVKAALDELERLDKGLSTFEARKRRLEDDPDADIAAVFGKEGDPEKLKAIRGERADIEAKLRPLRDQAEFSEMQQGLRERDERAGKPVEPLPGTLFRDGEEFHVRSDGRLGEKPEPAPTSEGVVPELHPDQLDVDETIALARADKIAQLEARLGELDREERAIRNPPPRRLSGQERGELLGEVPVGPDEHLGAKASGLKDRLEELYAMFERRTPPRQDVRFEPVLEERRRDLGEPPEGSFYTPLSATKPGDPVGRYTAPTPGPHGVGPTSPGRHDSSLTHDFTGDSMRMGKYRIDAPMLTVESGAKAVRLFSALDTYDSLWQRSAPARRSKFDVPIRSVLQIPKVLREIIAQGDENLPIAADELAKVSVEMLAALEKHLHPEQFKNAAINSDLSDKGIRWVDRRILGALAPNFEPPRGGAIKAADAINNPARLFYVYGRVAYILNLPGNMGMQAITQGLFAPRNYKMALEASKAWDEDTYRIASAIVGEGKARATSVNAGFLGKPTQAAAQFWSSFIDRHSRISSLIHEMRREDIDVNDPAAVKAFLSTPSSKRTAVARRANKAMVEFNNLTDVERNTVRHLIFLYPWMSRATVWAFRTLIEHPAKSWTLGQLAREAVDKQNEEAGELPGYLAQRGYFSTKVLGVDADKLINPTSINTFSTAADNGRVLLGLVLGGTRVSGGDTRGAREALSPAFDVLMGALTGETSRGKPYEGGTVTGALKEVVEAAPEWQLLRRAGLVDVEEADKPLHQRRVLDGQGAYEAVAPFLAGGLAPRSYDPEVAAERLKREKRAAMPLDEREADKVKELATAMLTEGRRLGYLDPGEPFDDGLKEAFRLYRDRKSAYGKAAKDRDVPLNRLTQRERLEVDLMLLQRERILTAAEVADELADARILTDEQIENVRRELADDLFDQSSITDFKLELRDAGAELPGN